jgi:hypothetical protein
MASSSTKDLTEGSYLTCSFVLGGEITKAMTWASALTYDDNKKFQDGLSCKSLVEKKIGPMGVGDGSPLQEYKR